MDYQLPQVDVWTFGGLRNVLVPNDPYELGSGFSLTKPNEQLLSLRDTHLMSEDEMADGARVGAYLLHKTKQPLDRNMIENDALQAYQHGLMAFQILKPVQTLGFIFQGEISDNHLRIAQTNWRHGTDAGIWANMRMFDQPLLEQVRALIPKIFGVMDSDDAEKKNSIILLQLALEHHHPLIAGLLSIMGLEAVFNSWDRNDFTKKLCSYLGSSTRAFPNWNSPNYKQPEYKIEDLALQLYTLRSKLAHGVDLRKAARDPKHPVDVAESVYLGPQLEPMPKAIMLAQPASCIHCQVRRKMLAEL